MSQMKKILIVDDQLGIRLLLQEVFTIEGYATMLASNGLQALTIFEAECPDLVLLDMKMPGMNGIETLKRMKLHNPSVKVIMMTAYGELEMVQQVQANGAIMYITKPFDIDDVREIVNVELNGCRNIS